MEYLKIVNSIIDKKTTYGEEYRKTYTLEQRRKEARRILLKYPDRIPIILSKNPYSENIGHMDKKKFLVPKLGIVSIFHDIIRKRVILSPEQSIYFILEETNTLPSLTLTLGQLYANFKSSDGFLYLIFSTENVFG